MQSAKVSAGCIGGGKMQEKMLSRRQQEVLTKIIRYRERHGFPPTVRELCELTGLKSTSSVAGHLNRLKELGYITWEDSMPRTITVVKGAAVV